MTWKPIGGEKTLEQRIFESWTHGKGLLLSCEDVELLIGDDAIACRITNEACQQVAVEEIGVDLVTCCKVKTWKKFKELVRNA